jgi:CRISPR-associated endoribonuclease Cas6
MRLIVKLRVSETSSNEMQYHYHLQGFLYSMLRESKYHFIHDKEGFKFFCFSNIFPVTKDIRKGELRTVLVSSPSTEFIDHLYERLQQKLNTATEIKIGVMRFLIDCVDKFSINLDSHSSVTLITGTPIILRIPRDKYSSFDNLSKNQYQYVYWRIGHPIQSFISQIQNNLLKKYSDYHELTNLMITGQEKILPHFQEDGFLLFQKWKFKKQISTRVRIRGFDQIVIGTLWEMNFNIDSSNNNIVKFALDCGLGERNSLGFGFMNIKT